MRISVIVIVAFFIVETNDETTMMVIVRVLVNISRYYMNCVLDSRKTCLPVVPFVVVCVRRCFSYRQSAIFDLPLTSTTEVKHVSILRQWQDT